MSFDSEKRIAAYQLSLVEDGTASMDDIRAQLEEADPVLIYLMFNWLRTRYHAGHPASEGVLGRIVEVCRVSPKIARAVREGEKDPISVWFEESYDYRDLDREELISWIVEKLEG